MNATHKRKDIGESVQFADIFFYDIIRLYIFKSLLRMRKTEKPGGEKAVKQNSIGRS